MELANGIGTSLTGFPPRISKGLGSMPPFFDVLNSSEIPSFPSIAPVPIVLPVFRFLVETGKWPPGFQGSASRLFYGYYKAKTTNEIERAYHRHSHTLRIEDQAHK